MVSTQMTIKAKFRYRISVLMLAMFASFGLSPVTAYAQDDDEPKPSGRQTRVVESISNSLASKLTKVAEAYDMEDFAEMENQLNDIRKGYEDYNTTEKATVWRYYAMMYLETEEYDKAITVFENQIKVPNIEEKAERLLIEGLSILGRLYLQADRIPDAIKTLERWFEMVPEPSANDYQMLSAAYFQGERYPDSLKAIETAIKMQTDAGNDVAENWYGIAYQACMILENYDRAFELTKILVKQYPSKQWYLALSQQYGTREEFFEQYSLLAALHDASMLNNNGELVTYSQFLLQQERPYKAAKVLESGMEKKLIDDKENNLKLLAQSWAMSREDEKAIPVLDRAAQLSEDGELYYLLGNMYLGVENWQKALEAGRKAFEKGDLRRDDNVWMLQGQALLNLKRYDQAITAFKNAAKDERSRNLANRLIAFANGEITRERIRKEAEAG